jgi:hypothetical protein
MNFCIYQLLELANCTSSTVNRALSVRCETMAFESSSHQTGFEVHEVLEGKGSICPLFRHS